MNVNLLIFFGMVLGVAVGLVASDTLKGIATSTNVWALAGTFSGAAVTIFGAIWVARHEISTRHDEAKKARERQRFAARAILALDLSRICNYTKKCAAKVMEADKICRIISSRGVGSRTKVACPDPVLNPDVTQRLQRLVELLDDDDADQVVALLHCFQVQYSRLSGVLDDFNSKSCVRVFDKRDFEFMMEGTVELRLRADSMLSFARRNMEHIPPPPYQDHKVENVFSVLNIGDWIDKDYRTSLVNIMGSLDSHGRWEQGQEQ